MTTQTIRIEGMTCNHCVMSVRRQLAGIDHLEVEDVQIGSAIVSYDEDKVETEDIDSAVKTAGFAVTAHE
ncbi:MAG: heavy-metal-associated domain-containing protein [Bacteroidetes bacterium]|nr:heavy-metal-associated domain-containing protein [Bacteroidota bacterium]